MTYRQARWAFQHDWCQSIQDIEGQWQITAVERTTGPGGYSEKLIKFNNFRTMLAWAGY